MIITGVVIAAAVLALIFFVLRGVGAARTYSTLQELTQQIEPVDLEAFRNLTEPSEEEFLRSALPPSQFRAIQRERLRAAIDYLGGVSHNAALLLQLGQAARQSADQQVAEVGRRVTDDALRMRMYSMMAIGKLAVRYVIPGAKLQPGGVIDRYQQLTSAAVRLGKIQVAEKKAV
ncbi:MAG TPA: hypothetical protein VK466_03790 [Terriglobales bacterium]|nr:hypothetical protein [Terriglobales bacterium]